MPEGGAQDPGGFRRLRDLEQKRITPRLAAAVISAFWVVAIIVFGIIERLVNPDTFDNVWLGMWWGIQTVTTVGYGDVVPTNTAGKLIAAILMIGGLSLFAVVTGAITSAFVAQAQERRRAERGDPVAGQLEEIRAQLDEIKAELDRLKRTSD